MMRPKILRKSSYIEIRLQGVIVGYKPPLHKTVLGGIGRTLQADFLLSFGIRWLFGDRSLPIDLQNVSRQK